mmetsp:Transcript_26445/g.54144  ORF Transcript_26445/g.54144 Transcript_26445/m.54144 type:complete len:86 (+) Transcript_26445:350-607(+)
MDRSRERLKKIERAALSEQQPGPSQNTCKIWMREWAYFLKNQRQHSNLSWLMKEYLPSPIHHIETPKIAAIFPNSSLSSKIFCPP